MLNFQFSEDNKTNTATKYDDLRKELVLHSASAFNDKHLNSYLCLETLTNLIYLFTQGENFSKTEKENLFFNVTKLLHSNHNDLKRMIFIFISHLRSIDNYFILTGPLLNEINGENVFLKTTSLRTIGHIIDLSNIAVVERHLKTALFHKTLEISSAAILCTYYLTLKGSDFAKSWIRELSDKINSAINQPNLQIFHLLILLKEIKQSDKLFLMKLYQNLCSPNLKSQFARCQLIRFIISMIKSGDVEDKKTFTAFQNYLENCLQKNQQESVILEAARGIIETPIFKNTLFPIAIESLKNLLIKDRKVFKYSALKTLDKAATLNPNINALDFFIDLEKIIEDSSNNASIKALALSIFLKISKSLSSSRLEKMFKTFTDQFSTFKEEFKKEIIIISRSISRQDPTKMKLYFNFFSSLIKLETEFSTKDELVDSIIWLIHNDKDLKKQAIFCLADYIEDCEFDNIKTKVLSILGQEGGTIKSSSQMIRTIYNRIILENPVVRCSAVSALGEIANSDPESVSNVLNLMKRSLNDSDHEVRERAYLYYKVLCKNENEENKNENESTNGDKENVNSNLLKLKKMAFSNKAYDVDVLQNILHMQKESLLLSDNISKDLNSILRNPDTIAKMLIDKNNANEAADNNNNKENNKQSKKKEDKKDKNIDKSDISAIITKAYGAPKLTSKYSVKKYLILFNRNLLSNMQKLQHLIESSLWIM